MYKEIEEMTKSYCDRTVECKKCDRYYECDLTEICEAIYDAGYRKQVWHKVADGDLPAQLKDVLCVTEDIYKDKMITVGCITNNNLWFLECDRERWHNIEDVIAWTELPEYKE